MNPILTVPEHIKMKKILVLSLLGLLAIGAHAAFASKTATQAANHRVSMQLKAIDDQI